MIAMPTASPVHRAGIKAGSATDTLQGVAEVCPAQLRTAPVIHNNYMHFLPLAWTLKMTTISSNRLPRCTPCQQAQKHTQMLTLRNDLFKAHTGNMHIS